MSTFNEKYKGVTIQGSHFPDAPINSNMKIEFSDEVLKSYIPTIQKLNVPKGLMLLCIIMTDHEGFWGKSTKHRSASRSFRTNNPGNIGNTDSGANSTLPTLQAGIELQIKYFNKILAGQAKAYPLGKKMNIKPYFSQEIADNYTTYRMSPYVPGYSFVFTGQLDQFLKIYSTGARAGNSYLSEIISFFKNHGITISGSTTLQELADIK